VKIMRKQTGALLAFVTMLTATAASGQPGATIPEDPPSGPGLGQPTTPAPTPTTAPAPTAPAPTVASAGGNCNTGTGPALPAVPVNTAPMQLTPDEKRQLADNEAEFARFTLAADEHDARMRSIAKREFDARSSDLTKKYADRIAKIESQKAKRHGDTVAKLEAFLAEHPHHETFTPDAMFRLADLYIDSADEEVEAKLTELETTGAAMPEGGVVADYSRSTALWERILTEFPSYRQTPSTLYLLGYYGKAKDERKSLSVFLALACSNQHKWNDPPPAIPTREEALKKISTRTLSDPYAACQAFPGADPELVRHAWVRGIADYHFTIPGEIDEAIAAYLKVADGGNDSKLYAEALYKLAWSYYKRDYLPDSIRRFDESVKLYDKIVADGGTPALELRDESIQYISVAFTDPWEGESNSDPVKGFERAQAFYKGRENEPHVRDVWVALGKAFTELQAWDQAVDSYRIAIGPPWELDPANPVVHQEIVNVFELKGDKFAADAAAAELATRYAPCTAWYAANEKDREAMENQRRIAERALYAATRNTHSAATQMRKDWEASSKHDPQEKQEYLAMYGKAVDLYRQFITTYPESDYIYEFTFLQGEALYWSERYMEAITSYEWVRDHRDMGTAYYLDAARSILQSYEAEVAKQVAAGNLAALRVPTIAELKATQTNGRWQAQQIPGIYIKLRAEYENYQNVVQDPKAAPSQAINAALIDLAYLHVDDALRRFRSVMTKYCGAPEAVKAKDGMLAIYEAQSNFDAIEETNKEFITAKCGDDASIKLALSQNRSLNFSRAADLYAKGDYIPAAEAFYRFYKTAPAGDQDLPIALYNAAASYKLGERPKTAIALFKEFTASSSKQFRESPFYLDAMRLTAVSQQQAFDYSNAVKTYLQVYDTAKSAKKKGIKAPDPLPGEQPRTLEQIGLDALYNAALAAELNRDFKQAISLYTKYQGVETDRRKQDRALWSVANIYRQSGDVNNMSDTYAKWRSKYGKDAGNEDDYVQSYYDVATLRLKKNQASLAKTAGADTIAAWKARGSIKSGRGAKLAGEWQLKQAEDYYAKTWEPYAIKTAAKTVAEATKQTQALDKAKTSAEDKYLALDAYAIAEYSMAAKVRYGDIQYGFAQKIADAPIPTPIAKVPSAVSTYETQRDANLVKFLNEARTDWLAVVDAAKQGGVSNAWSRLAMEELGREFPAEFTALRQEIIQGTEAP
jgi:hypothetical protein